MGQKAKISSGFEIPGLVDLQVNGYKGADFSSLHLTESDFVRACAELFAAGTTAFLPTMITSPQDVYKRNLALISAVLDRQEFCGRLLGVHLEGPFISPRAGARGAHDVRWITEPDISYLQQLIEWADGKIKLITIAAELEGAEQLTQYAVSRGIVVSLGHQLADEDDLQRLVRAGATCLTHLGNGVPAVLPRHHNPIWAGLANDDLDAMLITDGHHLPASVLKTIIRAKRIDRCVVVSDSSPLAGLKPGCYETLGHKVVLEDSGRLFDPATGYLVGSSATMLDCMNYLTSLQIVSLDELCALGFYNPLKLIGISAEGIAQGREVYFDQRHQVFHL